MSPEDFEPTFEPIAALEDAIVEHLRATLPAEHFAPAVRGYPEADALDTLRRLTLVTVHHMTTPSEIADLPCFVSYVGDDHGLYRTGSVTGTLDINVWAPYKDALAWAGLRVRDALRAPPEPGRRLSTLALDVPRHYGARATVQLSSRAPVYIAMNALTGIANDLYRVRYSMDTFDVQPLQRATSVPLEIVPLTD